MNSINSTGKWAFSLKTVIMASVGFWVVVGLIFALA